MRRRWVLFCAAWCLAFGAARPALAFPSSRFSYARAQGAEACPDEAAVRKAVASRLGYDPFFPSADKTIIAVIAREERGLHATVQLVDDQGIVKGVREFRTGGDKCDELVATLSLAISIAIDPTQLALAPDIEASPQRTREQRLPEEARAAPPASETRNRRNVEPTVPEPTRPLEVRPAIDISATAGTAPNPSLGVALSVGIRRGWTSLSVEGWRDSPASTAVSGGGRVSASMWGGSLVPCAHAGSLFLCALGSFGWMRGEGLDLATPRQAIGLYGAAGARVGVELPLAGRWSLRGHVEFLAALTRADLQVDGATKWTTPPIAARASVGLVTHFP